MAGAQERWKGEERESPTPPQKKGLSWGSLSVSRPPSPLWLRHGLVGWVVEREQPRQAVGPGQVYRQLLLTHTSPSYTHTQGG